MPTLLGREIFRVQLTAYKSLTFEDSVHSVHDVEHTSDLLHHFHRQLIAKIVLQEHPQEVSCVFPGLRYGAIITFPRPRHTEALDRVSELFLERGSFVSALPEYQLG